MYNCIYLAPRVKTFDWKASAAAHGTSQSAAAPNLGRALGPPSVPPAARPSCCRAKIGNNPRHKTFKIASKGISSKILPSRVLKQGLKYDLRRDRRIKGGDRRGSGVGERLEGRDGEGGWQHGAWQPRGNPLQNSGCLAWKGKLRVSQGCISGCGRDKLFCPRPRHLWKSLPSQVLLLFSQRLKPILTQDLQTFLW